MKTKIIKPDMLPDYALDKYRKSCADWGEDNVDCVVRDDVDDVFFFRNPATDADPGSWMFDMESSLDKREYVCDVCDDKFMAIDHMHIRALRFQGRLEIKCRKCWNWTKRQIEKRQGGRKNERLF